MVRCKIAGRRRPFIRCWSSLSACRLAADENVSAMNDAVVDVVYESINAIQCRPTASRKRSGKGKGCGLRFLSPAPGRILAQEERDASERRRRRGKPVWCRDVDALDARQLKCCTTCGVWKQSANANITRLDMGSMNKVVKIVARGCLVLCVRIVNKCCVVPHDAPKKATTQTVEQWSRARVASLGIVQHVVSCLHYARLMKWQQPAAVYRRTGKTIRYDIGLLRSLKVQLVGGTARSNRKSAVSRLGQSCCQTMRRGIVRPEELHRVVQDSTPCRPALRMRWSADGRTSIGRGVAWRGDQALDEMTRMVGLLLHCQRVIDGVCRTGRAIIIELSAQRPDSGTTQRCWMTWSHAHLQAVRTIASILCLINGRQGVVEMAPVPKLGLATRWTKLPLISEEIELAWRIDRANVICIHTKLLCAPCTRQWHALAP
ncbi:uncharacterized protein MYCFIDRAFT_172517 [Pseudocercospora fijiensis CIRAD86]|uniref:Uncharacterized protein n=1 Tax=Pseudocercospora fijiensis (strain CIRAD86) TaxID=383855 RepID=M3BC24_PSEFD|nr:uncharacterized protein MYCFIDRAFT_172517 [Pseudocercospora fijiensis CIRAD86]EME86827.1 hypothetical protein MYCFIDRAFT_172517 [Pseudocercospora fijiensis CIRAD86]